MNHFNHYLLGPESNIVDFAAKLTAFIRKLNFWTKNIENKQSGMSENVASLGGEPCITFVQEITKHLLLLKDEIKRYFFNDGDAQACICTWKPFTAKPDDLPVGTGEQEELIDLQCDEGAQEKFKDFTLANFWLNVSFSYPTLAKNAITQLLVFPATWECKQGFSFFLTIKSKTADRLVNPEHDFRCFVSKISPRLAKLVEEKQAQPSHWLTSIYWSINYIFCFLYLCVCLLFLFFRFLYIF